MTIDFNRLSGISHNQPVVSCLHKSPTTKKTKNQRFFCELFVDSCHHTAHRMRHNRPLLSFLPFPYPGTRVSRRKASFPSSWKRRGRKTLPRTTDGSPINAKTEGSESNARSEVVKKCRVLRSCSSSSSSSSSRIGPARPGCCCDDTCCLCESNLVHLLVCRHGLLS